MQRILLNRLTKNELEVLMSKLGEKKYRAAQIFENIHKHRKNQIKDFTNLSKGFRETLSNHTSILQAKIVKKIESKKDDTIKYLIEFEDNQIVEAVFMKYRTHTTLCISTQIGCQMGCRFCASSKTPFIRNLMAEEMLSEVYEICNDLDQKIANIVLMGIGEPLENFDEVIRFIRLITSSDGYDMSIRNITLSTCGLVSKIRDLADSGLPINLTISLHNPFDEQRTEIMPIAKKYLIKDILSATDYYFQKTGRRIGFEYTVIEGVNDSDVHMNKLVELLRGRNCLLNLIELNEIQEFKGSSSSQARIQVLKEQLNQKGIQTTVRRKQGEDIEGACGQLRINQLEKE